MTNTATSPLKPEREEMSCTKAVSSGIRGEGGFDFMSVRKLAETERRASFGGSSGVQSIPPGRSGALLPALPSGAGGEENKALSEKGLLWTRSGSLSEQQFIEQINEMRGVPPSTSVLVSQGSRLKNEQQMDEQLNFELDEEYEREGEEILVEDDEDDLDVQRQLMSEAAGQVYTIPEESEEESPRVEKKEDEPRKGVCSPSIQSPAPRASRSLPSFSLVFHHSLLSSIILSCLPSFSLVHLVIPLVLFSIMSQPTKNRLSRIESCREHCPPYDPNCNPCLKCPQRSIQFFVSNSCKKYLF